MTNSVTDVGAELHNVKVNPNSAVSNGLSLKIVNTKNIVLMDDCL